jgi:hypothetical protein
MINLCRWKRTTPFIAALVSVGILGACSQPHPLCAPVHPEVDFELTPAHARESEQDARGRAERCIHYLARKLAVSTDPTPLVVDAVLAACSPQIQHAEAAGYFAAGASRAKSAPPPGFVLETKQPCPAATPACHGDGAKATIMNPDTQMRASGEGLADNATLAAVQGETMKRVRDDMRAVALYRVEEARAGKCSAP